MFFVLHLALIIGVHPPWTRHRAHRASLHQQRESQEQRLRPGRVAVVREQQKYLLQCRVGDTWSPWKDQSRGNGVLRGEEVISAVLVGETGNCCSQSGVHKGTESLKKGANMELKYQGGRNRFLQ